MQQAQPGTPSGLDEDTAVAQQPAVPALAGCSGGRARRATTLVGLWLGSVVGVNKAWRAAAEPVRRSQVCDDIVEACDTASATWTVRA
jgi:hypothetical protein